MSLYKQLLIGICLFAVVVFCGNCYVALESSRDQYHNQLSAHAQDTATALGVSLTTNIDDPAMTDLLVSSIFDSGYFSRIRVVDLKTHRVLTERYGTPQDTVLPGWFVRLVNLNPGKGEAIVMRGWTQYARVEVISHPMFALQRLWKGMVNSFFWFAVCSLLCVTGTTVFLRRRLRPLNYIVKQATAISHREFLSLPTLPKTPELRRVVEATNMMVTQLKALFSEQAQRTEALRQEAYHDSLTGLNNRRAFDIHLHARLSDEEKSAGHLLLVRVQDLTGLNQRMGGEKTDELLKAVAGMLSEIQQRYFHFDGFLARIRGGEFALVGQAMLSQEMDNLVSQLGTQLKALYDTGISDVSPVAHLAQTTFHPGDTPQAVLRQVDQALAEAETRMRFFATPSAAPAADADDDRHSWLSRLSSVLDAESFELFSQPVFGCDNPREVLHHKILARIKTGEGETLPASRFMPWIHRLALGQRMDQVMLKQTLHEMARTEGVLSLSICGESVADDESLEALLQPLKQAPALAARLILALDENELPSADRMSDVVRRLKAVGCRLGIQHFGGQFHLIGNLPQWGLAWIKVDGSYVRNIDTEEDKRLFIEAIYWATRQIDLPLIAERVETAGELAILESIGLYGAMGRYFADARTLQG
ncbi:EAL domain-containing protein [Erwinia sp. CPCC 100877]|nr:EAL domain-containing protein [Erwinia sp. CPCC 100877]